MMVAGIIFNVKSFKSFALNDEEMNMGVERDEREN